MKDWDTVKFILVASLFLCVAGLGLFYYQDMDLKKLETSISPAKRTLTQIGTLGAEVDMRQQELADDERQQQGLKVRQYIERQANNSRINYNQELRCTTENPRKDRKGGYEDRPHVVNTIRKTKIPRMDIAKFVFNLQINTNRMKVTELILDNPSNDKESWSLNLKVVERKSLAADSN